MTEATTPYVVQTPEGAWRVNGTRVSLDSIVHAYWNGRQPEAIAADFPTVSLEKIHGAIAYYLRNRLEIDAYMETQSALWKEFQKESSERLGPLLKRIRESALSNVGA